MVTIAKRAREMTPFIVMEILERAEAMTREGIRIIHLEVGEPDFDILEKAHVGVTPGIDFGENGEGYLRFSYANSMENIIEGMDRLEAYLESRA